VDPRNYVLNGYQDVYIHSLPQEVTRWGCSLLPEYYKCA